MDSLEEEIKKKIKFLELAKELGNITKAARIMGYTATTYYNLKKIYERDGEDGLRHHVRRKPNPNKRLDKNIEEIVLKFSSDNPKYGNSRISKELKIQGIKVSTGSVHSILKKHNLNTSKKRIKKFNHE